MTFDDVLTHTLELLQRQGVSRIEHLNADSTWTTAASYFHNQGFADTGGLMAYDPSFSEMVWRAAVYLDKILKGTKPVDLPVERPTRFALVINLKTAKELDLIIPPSLL